MLSNTGLRGEKGEHGIQGLIGLTGLRGSAGEPGKNIWYWKMPFSYKMHKKFKHWLENAIF